MPNLNPQDARTYNPAPTLWKYDPQTSARFEHGKQP
jgi:hypothetical protein